MKKVVLFPIILLLFQHVLAQNKLELFELIKMMIPNEENNTRVMSWNASPDLNKFIKWKSLSPKSSLVYGTDGKKMEQWRKEGNGRILLNGVDFTCENRVEGIKHPCLWEMSLFGSSKGYSGFYVNNTDFPIDDQATAIDMLFREKAGYFRRINKCVEGAVMWQDLYTLKIPGKKSVWLLIQFESLSATGGQYNHTKTDNLFTLAFYFKKEDIPVECGNIPEFPEETSKNSGSKITTAGTTPKQMETDLAGNKKPSGRDSTATSEVTTITKVAEVLFTDVKTNLSVKERNEIASLTGISMEELTAQSKKGKAIFTTHIYPVDFNTDGTEEIFLCITTKTLGIPINTYFFYTKGSSGNYQPSPGRIGSGLKIISGENKLFPDLITLNALTTRERWSWNGNTYRLVQTIPAGTINNFSTENIEEVSEEYNRRK